ncbi:hypothetical protein CRUP_012605 [Coryphaenoides rupestris]|nr:hypothetical protein CRUP_012605 [Coryphaenoides rupestris]
MAQAGVVLDKDQFNCSICLDVLREPVTIPCGHSYCSGCIKHYWDQDEYLGVYGCPQCRQSFNPRPRLGRNTMLADVVERFKNTNANTNTPVAAAATSSSSPPDPDQDQDPDPTVAGPEDVECDVCTGRKKKKAVKSCLGCLASYCEAHLQPHYESAAFKKHRLVTPSERLQETLCPRHDKLLEVYCRTDQQCICYLCLTDEHKGHDTVLAEAEIQEKKTHLDEMRRQSQQNIQEREKESQELSKAIMSLTRSTRTVMEESDKVFTELIRSIELKRFESCQSLSAPPVATVLPSFSVDQAVNFGLVMTAINDFKSLLQEVCQEGLNSIFERSKEVTIVDSPIHPPGLEEVQLNDQASVHMNALPTALPPTPGLDQAPMAPMGPLNPGPTLATFRGFAISPFGSKLSSASRQRHLQRRSHPRRK